MIGKNALRSRVLQLYKACLRSAQKCPEWEHREMMKRYVQLKFRDETHTQDPKRIQSLLHEAQEELDRMEFFHSMYQLKQQQKQKQEQQEQQQPQQAMDSKEQQLASVCAVCQTKYEPAHARFCSNCGTKRPGL